jgi:N-acetylglutamate synthase-like GNAT family acetyltransferase
MVRTLFVNFRQAKKSDLEVVQKCIRDAFFPNQAIQGSEPYALRSDYQVLIEEEKIFILEDSSHLAGVVCLSSEADHLYLSHLAIDPDRQSSGYGKRILEEAEKIARARGLTEIKLNTNAKLDPLLKFYGKRGFQETHREKREDRTLVFFSKKIFLKN